MIITDVPVHLIPHAVRTGILRYHEEIERIVVRRIRFHHYNVSVHSRSIKRELRPVIRKAGSPEISPGRQESVA